MYRLSVAAANSIKKNFSLKEKKIGALFTTRPHRSYHAQWQEVPIMGNLLWKSAFKSLEVTEILEFC